jgi:adenylate kinase family enzyme
MPVLALYEEQGLLWIVDAEKAMEEVYQSCKTAVEGMLGKK